MKTNDKKVSVYENTDHMFISEIIPYLIQTAWLEWNNNDTRIYITKRLWKEGIVLFIKKQKAYIS